jgi:hypothetical protein
MRPNLGRVIFIIFVFVNILYAKDLEYKISVDKNNPFVKEVVILKMDLNQLNKNIVLLYDFDLVKKDSYDFKRIEATESDIDNNAKALYTYLVYPLKDGAVDIEFDLIKKVTTKENLAYSFSGDRDNVKGLVTTDTKIDVKPFRLNVKSIPKDTELVGDFKLKYEVKTHSASSYEPINMKVNIEGIGYPAHFTKLSIKNKEINIFADTPIKTINTSDNDTFSSIDYPMAFSSKKSFTIDTISIKAFNPKTNQTYFLKIPKQKFDIKEVSVNDLIDKEDSSEIKTNSLDDVGKSLKVISLYIIVFLCGLISGYLLKFKKKKQQLKITTSVDKIQNAKDVKELLKILILQDDKKYKDVITECEDSLYNGKKINLKNLKRKIDNL